MFTDISWKWKKNINYFRDRFQINFCFLFAFCVPYCLLLLLLVLSRKVDTKPSRDSVIYLSVCGARTGIWENFKQKISLEHESAYFSYSRLKIGVYFAVASHYDECHCRDLSFQCEWSVKMCWPLVICLSSFLKCERFGLAWLRLTFNELLKMIRLISDGVWKCKNRAIWTSVSLNYARNASLFLKLVHVSLRASLKIICFDSSECVIRLSCLFLFIFRFVYYVLFHRFCSVIDMKQKRNNGYILFILVLTLASISISCVMNRNRSDNNNNNE